MINVYHFLMRAPSWVREEFAAVVVVMILGWLTIGFVITFIVRLLRRSSTKKESKS